MEKKIMEALRALEIPVYSIVKEQRSTAELFFIRRQLDMRRMKDVTEYTVYVYHDFAEGEKKYRGSAKVLLFPGMEQKDIFKTLEEAYCAAGHVKNDFYELYAGPQTPFEEVASTLSGRSLTRNAEEMAKALFAADNRKDAFLNSAELFVQRKETKICNSLGTDVSYGQYSVSGEFVAQSKEPQDVEQYFSFRYEGLDTQALTEKVRRALDTVRDRAHARKAPKAGVYDVVLSGEHVYTLLDLYVARTNASQLYPGYSDWKKGVQTQGAALTGEGLNLTLVPSAPYSWDGVPMKERLLLKEGQVQCLHGPTRFCRYMGEEPVGEYRRVRLDNGTVPFEQMKKGCLYPVSFSDFQLDVFSGYFGGEIRLAYLYTDKGVEKLTGGSINGSLLEKQGSLTFSLERYQDAGYEGPLAVRIPGVSVNGK